MEDNRIMQKFGLPHDTRAIIKVIGVGGGGGNAVTHMYREGIHDVSFALCNTDSQAMNQSEVPTKLCLGPSTTKGGGAGNIPDVAKAAAMESESDIRRLLSDGTRMVFITAGMGGGTGTGAAPVIAGIARSMDILTVGIVTIPFMFEGKPKIIQALNGVEKMGQNVDALLVVNNERLRKIYRDFSLLNAFKKVDDTLTNAAKSIAEIITLPGIINLDFADVNTTMKNGGVALMSNGFGQGERRMELAIEDALNSPLLNNNDVFTAKKILFNISCSSQSELKVEEFDPVHDFMSRFDSQRINVIWGAAIDNSLGDKVKFTVLASGFDMINIPEIREKRNDELKRLTDEEIIREDERLRQELEDEELINRYYPEDLGSDKKQIRPVSRSSIIVLTLEEMENEDIISLMEDSPTYNRDPKLIMQLRNKNGKEAGKVTAEDSYHSDRNQPSAISGKTAAKISFK
ncbi:MAG: cell division protein FtsZ [Tannerella sp.]|jgi:cell division protein FtsZ|nr:cell division protein FtsZ [Tannerella sp.]